MPINIWTVYIYPKTDTTVKGNIHSLVTTTSQRSQMLVVVLRESAAALLSKSIAADSEFSFDDSSTTGNPAASSSTSTPNSPPLLAVGLRRWTINRAKLPDACPRDTSPGLMHITPSTFFVAAEK